MTNIVAFPTSRRAHENKALNPWSDSEDEVLSGLDGLVRAYEEKVLSKIPLLGAATWLMLQKSSSCHAALGDLNRRLMPALIQEQAKLYTKDGMPAAFVSWAYLSDAAAHRYRSQPHKLMANDWCSGDQIWIIDIFTRYAKEQEIVDALRETVFSGKDVRRLISGVNADPGVKVLKWSAMPAKATSKRG